MPKEGGEVDAPTKDEQKGDVPVQAKKAGRGTKLFILTFVALVFILAAVLIPVLILVPCSSKYTLRTSCASSSGPSFSLRFELDADCSALTNATSIAEMSSLIISSLALQSSLAALSVTSSTNTCQSVGRRHLVAGGQAFIKVLFQWPKGAISEAAANNLALTLSSVSVAAAIFDGPTLARYSINGPPYIVPYLNSNTFSPPPSPPPGSPSTTQGYSVVSISSIFTDQSQSPQPPGQSFFLYPSNGDVAFYVMEGLNSTQTSSLRSGQQIQIGPPSGGPPSGVPFGPNPNGAQGPTWQGQGASIDIIADAAFVPQDPAVIPQSQGKRRRMTVTMSTLSVLYIPISFEGCTLPSGSGTYAAPSYTQTSIQTLRDWTSSMFSSCSYGKTTMTSASTSVSPVLKLACSGKIYGNSWTARTCASSDYIAWADTADLNNLASYDIDSNSYTYHIYILPDDTACSWSTTSRRSPTRNSPSPRKSTRFYRPSNGSLV